MRIRNRQKKATFWTDGDLLRWPRDKRYFYESLWSCAEDSCCIIDDMFEVKLTAWPSPLDADLTVELLEQWRDELIECGKLIPYEADGRRYLFIPRMAEHEKPRNPQVPDWPLPPWVTYAVTGDGRNRRCTYTFSYTTGDRDASVQYASGNRDTVQTDSGDRNITVQSASGNRDTSPALPCPDQPLKDTSKKFDEFWKRYPRKEGKKDAIKAFEKALKSTDADTILAGLSEAIAYWKREGTDKRFIPLPATWLNGCRWEDELPPPTQSEPVVRDVIPWF